jgi:hypothetical protein
MNYGFVNLFHKETIVLINNALSPQFIFFNGSEILFNFNLLLGITFFNFYESIYTNLSRVRFHQGNKYHLCQRLGLCHQIPSIFDQKEVKNQLDRKKEKFRTIWLYTMDRQYLKKYSV